MIMADEQKLDRLIELLANTMSDYNKKLDEELQSFRQQVCTSKFYFHFPNAKH